MLRLLEPTEGSILLEGQDIGKVAEAFGVPRNAVSQAKTRVERMVADFEEMLSD